MIRPSKVYISDKPGEGEIVTPITVLNREMLGDDTHYQIKSDSLGLLMVTSTGVPLPEGIEPLYASIKKKHLYLFDEDGNRVFPDNPSFDEELASVLRLLNEKVK